MGYWITIALHNRQIDSFKQPDYAERLEPWFKYVASTLELQLQLPKVGSQPSPAERAIIASTSQFWPTRFDLIVSAIEMDELDEILEALHTKQSREATFLALNANRHFPLDPTVAEMFLSLRVMRSRSSALARALFFFHSGLVGNLRLHSGMCSDRFV